MKLSDPIFHNAKRLYLIYVNWQARPPEIRMDANSNSASRPHVLLVLRLLIRYTMNVLRSGSARNIGCAWGAHVLMTTLSKSTLWVWGVIRKVILDLRLWPNPPHPPLPFNKPIHFVEPSRRRQGKMKLFFFFISLAAFHGPRVYILMRFTP